MANESRDSSSKTNKDAKIIAVNNEVANFVLNNPTNTQMLLLAEILKQLKLIREGL